MAGLMEEYRNRIAPMLMERFGYRNRNAAPRLVKIVVSMRISSGDDSKDALEDACKTMSMITGQQPASRRARKSVSGFKLREGDMVGCVVTLRGKRMYEFLERLIHGAIPRVRDFRGLNPSSFDGMGNYSMGIEECIIFPELSPDDVRAARGMNITIVSSNRSDEEAAELLRMLGMPFRKDDGGQS